jgi:hypothetical protein
LLHQENLRESCLRQESTAESASIRNFRLAAESGYIILIVALLGGFSGIGGGSFYGTGYYGGGGPGLAVTIVLILVVLGKL